MGVLTDYVLAPLSDAPAVARALDPVERWGGIRQKSVMSTDLSILHALLRGEDPDAPATPKREVTNPFTKATFVLTRAMELADAFETVAEDGEVVVEKLPEDLVHRLSTVGSAQLEELASAWVRAYEKYAPTSEAALELLTQLALLARRSVAEGTPVLLRTCP